MVLLYSAKFLEDKFHKQISLLESNPRKEHYAPQNLALQIMPDAVIELPAYTLSVYFKFFLKYEQFLKVVHRNVNEKPLNNIFINKQCDLLAQKHRDTRSSENKR